MINKIYMKECDLLKIAEIEAKMEKIEAEIDKINENITKILDSSYGLTKKEEIIENRNKYLELQREANRKILIIDDLKQEIVKIYEVAEEELTDLTEEIGQEAVRRAEMEAEARFEERYPGDL